MEREGGGGEVDWCVVIASAVPTPWLQLGMPNTESRRCILEVLLRGENVAADIDLEVRAGA